MYKHTLAYMKFFTSLLLILGLSLNSVAQTKAANIGTDMRLGAQQIAFIKQNGVFIRLRTNDMAVQAMKKAGNTTDAERLQAKQKEANEPILEAFKKNFSFSKVYFFYSRDQDEFNKGDFSKLYNLDGTKATYTARDFLMIDPYTAEVKSMNSQSTGFSLLTSDGAEVKFPMPINIIKRFGPIYRTYPQLVFDWDYMFYEMAHLGKEIESGNITSLLKTPGANFSKAEVRRIIKARKDHRKNFKKSFNDSERPKNVNKES